MELRDCFLVLIPLVFIYYLTYAFWLKKPSPEDLQEELEDIARREREKAAASAIEAGQSDTGKTDEPQGTPQASINADSESGDASEPSDSTPLLPLALSFPPFDHLLSFFSLFSTLLCTIISYNQRCHT